MHSKGKTKLKDQGLNFEVFQSFITTQRLVKMVYFTNITAGSVCFVPWRMINHLSISLRYSCIFWQNFAVSVYFSSMLMPSLNISVTVYSLYLKRHKMTISLTKVILTLANKTFLKNPNHVVTVFAKRINIELH